MKTWDEIQQDKQNLKRRLLPNPPDKRLKENEYYFNYHGLPRVVTLLEMGPVTCTERAVIQTEEEKLVVREGLLYDNMTDCAMHTHDSWNGWKYFREHE